MLGLQPAQRVAQQLVCGLQAGAQGYLLKDHPTHWLALQLQGIAQGQPIAEIETVYKPKTVAEQFREDMNNDSWFFEEYIKRYPGTAIELARKADIDNSTISKIKKHLIIQCPSHR